jgi:NTE family protein
MSAINTGEAFVKSGLSIGRWIGSVRRKWTAPPAPARSPAPVRIGLALGGGFARGISHAGLLEVFERNGIRIDYIAGVSAGAIVAAAYASGASAPEIARVGCSMRFNDVARWTVSRMGFAASERMNALLKRLLKVFRFEEMRIPLAIVATDIATAQPVTFQKEGEVLTPVRASCSYPGLFLPVRHGGRLLVDGAISMEIPARAVRAMGATHVISVHIPNHGPGMVPGNVFQVVNRCFQILLSRTENSWRSCSDLVIEPDLRTTNWDAFDCGEQILDAGAMAAMAALPAIREWYTESRGHLGCARRRPLPVANAGG